jgi:large subunit ribosomal protein L15
MKIKEEPRMKINELPATPGARKTAFRKGRGVGSGNGKTAGRGHKGQNARAGGGVRPGFEGGQMPIYRRLPKRGFNNKRFALKMIEVNVGDLERFDNGTVVDAALLKASGVISLPKVNDGVKILGFGELSKQLTVKASGFTAAAREKIEKAGGKAEEV